MDIQEDRFRIWSEISNFIDEITGDLFCTSDDLHKIIFNKNKDLGLENLIEKLNEKDLFLRIENDEELFYLSIIDRKVYPRIWADNFKEEKNIILSESTNHFIERSICGNEKDWIVRFIDKKLYKCVIECHKYLINNYNEPN